MQRHFKNLLIAFLLGVALLQPAIALADNPSQGAYTPPSDSPGSPCTYTVNTPGVGPTSGSGTIKADGSCSGISTGVAGGTAVDNTGKQIGSSANNNQCSGLTSCLANMVYYIGPGFASWVASWSAYFFDFIVRISIQSPAYSLTFLADSWNLVLSLANMFFIFILIYAAFVIMLRAETARTLQTLAWVIAIALVVNFSFFFTRVVIDAGNILGTQFYNAVAVQSPNLNAGANSTVPATPDITQPMMQALGLETLLNSNTFSLISSSLDSGWGALLVLTVIYIFAAIMFWVLAVALLMVGLKFFLRVVGLWLVLVASPLAFVAQTLSNTRKFFDMWLRTLVSFSVYPAVFLFMFWVLDKFVIQLAGGAGGLQNILTNNAALSANAAAGTAGAAANPYPLLVLIANVSIRMMFVITMLWIMLKVSDWIIEQAGGIASTFINRGSAAILGGGLRTAANLGAFAGRNTAGRLGNSFAQSRTGQNLLANSKLGVGTALWRSANALGRSTFDARNSTKATAAGGLIGTLSRTRSVDVGRGSQKNREGSVEEQAARVKAEGEALRANPKEVRAVGKDAAKTAERERLTSYIERKAEGNVSNAGIPSMGSLKGASALQKALDEQRAKEKKAADKEAKAAAPQVKTTISTPTATTTVDSHGAKTVAVPIKPIFIPPSEVASNTLSDEERAARLAPTNPTKPTGTSGPAAVALTPVPPPAPAVSTTPAPAVAPAPLTAAATTSEDSMKELGARFERFSKRLAQVTNQVAESNRFVAENIAKSNAQLTKKVEEAAHRTDQKIESGLHRQDLKTHDQLKKLEKQVAADLINHRGPDGDGGGTSPAGGAMQKPAEHSSDDDNLDLPMAA